MNESEESYLLLFTEEEIGSESSFTNEELINKSLENVFTTIDNVYKIKRYEMNLYGSDLSRLRPGCWINDKIINLYMLMMMERFKNIYCFSTHTYTAMENRRAEEVEEWFDDVDIFSYKHIVIPIHTYNHWTLIIVCKETVYYYDSMGGLNIRAIVKIKKLMEVLYMKKYRVNISYSCKNMSSRMPQQTNGDDCGVFCCMYARFLVDPDIKSIFESKNIPDLRAKMLCEILNGKIIFSHCDDKE